jgi:diguanylate cyclase (GGDEF)-like protein/PAS domain S-box-containing protein
MFGQMTGKADVDRRPKRKNKQQMLKRTDTLLKDAQGIARIGFWQLDGDTLDFVCSEGMLELFELDENGSFDRYRYADRVHPDDRPLLDSAFSEAIKTASRLDVQHRVTRRDGSIRHFRVMGRVDRNDDGHWRIVGTTQDITEMVCQEIALRESERRLTATIEASPLPLALNDQQGRVIYLNAAFCRAFGYQLSEIPTFDHWWPLAHPDPDCRLRIQDDWHSRLIEATASGAPFRPMEIGIRAKDGAYRTVVATATPVEPAADGLLLVAFYDITDRKRLEEQLLHHGRYLQSVIDASPTALAMFDADRRLVGVNRRFYEIHQIGPEDEFSPGKDKFDDLARYLHARGDFPKLPADAFISQCIEHIDRRQHLRFERTTFQNRVMEFECIPLETGGTLISCMDITDRARKLDDAQIAALHDPLTLLPNRRALENRYDGMMTDQPARSTLAALLLIDLDRFKAINDRFGHIYGDLLLVEVADRLRACVANTKLIFRLGGDEFIVLISGSTTDKADARQTAERIAADICASLSAPYRLQPAAEEGIEYDECIYECSASVGGWVLPPTTVSLTIAIKKADEALYRAKSLGRNAIVIH